MEGVEAFDYHGGRGGGGMEVEGKVIGWSARDGGSAIDWREWKQEHSTIFF